MAALIDATTIKEFKNSQSCKLPTHLTQSFIFICLFSCVTSVVQVYGASLELAAV
jgi:hypothetical protein